MRLSKFSGVYIPSMEAKDLVGIDYSLYRKDGNLNIRRFINSLGYSLELIKLREAYREITGSNDGFSCRIDGKEYCNKVINLTFKYSVKKWNKFIGKDCTTYILFSQDIRELEFKDSICMIDGEVVGIQVGQKVNNEIPQELLPAYFKFNPKIETYEQVGSLPTQISRSDLRQELYTNGFTCDGVKYVRYKRSSGASRLGKCLFIEQSLYDAMMRWSMCGLRIKEDDPLDLAAFEAYTSLTLSTIIGTVKIKKENILVVNDYDSIFREKVSETKIVDGKLITEEAELDIENSIWDGQSIADTSLFENYPDRGMILLRNKFFKSACFNCNLQQWFYDNGVTDVRFLNGFSYAKNISDIKLITTRSSIKYDKFQSVQSWLNNTPSTFGVVKYDKPQSYFDGRMVRIHYQLLNSLQLSREEVDKLVRPSLDHIDLLRTNPSVLRHYLKSSGEFEDTAVSTNNELVFKLLSLNSKFYRTKLCRKFIGDLVRSYYKELRCGHILVDGTYATLFGNPISMLRQAIGKFKGQSEFENETCHNTFFGHNENIVGSRSPHISFSNVLVLRNTHNELINKYFNLSKEIICINSIGENIQNRLSGSDESMSERNRMN